MIFRPFHVNDHLYFITGTILNWTPIFDFSEYRTIILNSWQWHRLMGRCKLFAFVVMPDHIHWITYPLPPYTINKLLWSFSSYTAHEILRTAKSKHHYDFLYTFSQCDKPGRKHQIWQSFLTKNIYTYRFLMQKMEYIHDNPTRKFPLMYRNRFEFLYSSAIYYDLGVDPVIEIDDIYDFMDSINQ